MTEEMQIDECFNCKKKKDISDNWRTCKLKCSYKYKRKENDYITRLEQENKELKEWKTKVVMLFESACRCKYLNEETDICSYTNEKCININKCVYKYQELSSNYRSALEEIRENLVKLNTNDEDDFTYEYSKIEDKINEVLGC